MRDASDNPADFRHIRFLVVDESVGARRLLESMLIRSGGRWIDQAASATEAARLIVRNTYDVILCDYDLGVGHDGQQLLEELRYKGLLRASTRFVMVTAEKTAQAVMGILECRPDDYFSRPFTRRQLAARITRLLRRRAEVGDIQEALEEQHYERALALCEERMAAGGEETFEVSRLKAEALCALERFPQAEAIYAQVFTDSGAAWAGLGSARCSYRRGDFASAVAVLGRTRALHPHRLEVYDGLARAQAKLGDRVSARAALAVALELSPRSIRRQMALGELALQDGDYRLAARAFAAAVALGGHSVFRTASNYIKQARALMQFDARDALRVLHELRRDFGDDAEARLRAAASECLVHRRLGDSAGAQAARAEAMQIYARLDRRISPEAMVDLARMLFAHGGREDAVELMRRAVANRHEDEDLLQEVRAIFREEGMGDEGERLIADARDGVVRLNNEGVRLAEEGRLEEAIELFRHALRDLPSNRTINMNTAKVLLLRMRRDGRDDGQLRQARECLERLRRMDPAAGALQRLSALYREVAETD